MSGYLVFDSLAQAEAMRDRVDSATGYPRNDTDHAVAIEPHASTSRYAVQVTPVIAWDGDTPRLCDVAAELLSADERAALVSFDALIAQGWYGV